MTFEKWWQSDPELNLDYELLETMKCICRCAYNVGHDQGWKDGKAWYEWLVKYNETPKTAQGQEAS
jgi:hypothetical protein